MKYIIFLACLMSFLSCFTTKANFAEDTPEGIKFKRTSWDETIACAKLENKLIFLDIYASWCGPCNKLKSTTFSVKDVGDFYNENFINIAIDGEKGEGPWIASKFQVRGYPTLLFLDHDENIISIAVGYHDNEDFLQLGQDALLKNHNKM